MRVARCAAARLSTISAPSARAASIAVAHRRLDLGLACPRRSTRAARRCAGRRRRRSSARRVVAAPARQRRRVARVVAGDRFEQERRVAHVAGERADLVERRGEGDQPVARDAAVGRLQPDDAAEAPPAGGSSRRCRCRARRALGPRPRPPPSRRDEPPGTRSGPRGCARGQKARVLGRRAHRELVHVRLAEQHGAGGCAAGATAVAS